MPYNGSGGTTQPAGSIYPAAGNTLIESAKANASIADIYTMLATCLLKDGQQVATARIPFASGISTDTVTEKTSDTGVTIDSVLLKDGRIDTTQGADIVCAATINLETATGNVVDVTGNTGPVTAITLAQGRWRVVRFTGTPTLTNGASLVLPGGANITVAAGDYALFIGYASSVVRCMAYHRASGGIIASATQAQQEAGTSATMPVTPSVQQFHASAVKGWAKCQFDGTAAGSYNVTSLTDNGGGDITITWATDFSGTQYAAVATAVIDPLGTSGSVRFTQCYSTGYAAGSTRVWCGDGSYAGVDASFLNVLALGDQ